MSGAVDFSECPKPRRCRCGKCAVCGFEKHCSLHGPFFGQPPGSRPYNHEFKPQHARRETGWPKDRETMQHLVDGAEGALSLDSARQYGLVTGGPVIDAERCRECLEEGKRRGIMPSPDAAEKFIQEILQEERLRRFMEQASPGDRRELNLKIRQAEMRDRMRSRRKNVEGL